jgi:excisionase family DNA binding protein
MSAYATAPRHLRAMPTQEFAADSDLIGALVAQLAEQVAARIAEQLSGSAEAADEWFDSRHAAEYLGVHRDTLRKLAAERAISSEQDGPGCKLYFRRLDLDAWRHSGGRATSR